MPRYHRCGQPPDEDLCQSCGDRRNAEGCGKLLLVVVSRKDWEKNPEKFARMANEDCKVLIKDKDGKVKTILGGNLNSLPDLSERQQMVDEGWIPPGEAKRLFWLSHNLTGPVPGKVFPDWGAVQVGSMTMLQALERRVIAQTNFLEELLTEPRSGSKMGGFRPTPPKLWLLFCYSMSKSAPYYTIVFGAKPMN